MTEYHGTPLKPIKVCPVANNYLHEQPQMFGTCYSLFPISSFLVNSRISKNGNREPSQN